MVTWYHHSFYLIVEITITNNNITFHSLQTATLVVGSSCDFELWVKHGQRLGNYSCAGRSTQHLDDR